MIAKMRPSRINTVLYSIQYGLLNSEKIHQGVVFYPLVWDLVLECLGCFWE